MAVKMSSLYDDFGEPGLDRSKWGDPALGTSGVILFSAANGLQMSPAATGTNVGVNSNTAYDMTDNYAYVQLGTMPVGLFSNAATSVAFYVTSNTTLSGYRAYFQITSVAAVWKLQAIMYNAANALQTLTGTVTVNWNPTSQKFLRHYHAASGRHSWQYSSDGSNWITLAYLDGTAAMTSMYTSFRVGNGVAAGQYFNIRYFNTQSPINRGSGYVADSFSTYPIMAIPTYSVTPPEQFGLWINKSGTQSINQVDDAGGVLTVGANALSIAGTGTILSSTFTTIKDIDFTAKVRIQASATSGRLIWRCDSTEANYWYLRFTTTQTILGYFSGAADHDISTWTTNMGSTKFWTYRIIHVGTEIVVYRDSGYGIAGYGNATIELTPRATANANVNTAGVIGFKSLTQTTYVKDVTVSGGVMPAAPLSYTTTDASQVKLWELGARTSRASNLEYLYLQDSYGNLLNLLPSYGDIRLKDWDLGAPVVRQIVKQKPLGNGATSNTRFHGEKSVSLSLNCYKTAYQEAQYYVDLVSRWTRPGWKSQLVYKPRGNDERVINIEGTSLGKGVITNVSDQRISVDVVFLAVDGGDYESSTQMISLTPAVVGYASSTGNLPTEPVIRIYGPCTNPVIYLQTTEAMNPGTFARLGFTIILDATEFIEIDTKTRDVRYMGWTDPSASYRQYLSIHDWFVMEPLRNAFYYVDDVLDPTTYATVTWSDKY